MAKATVKIGKKWIVIIGIRNTVPTGYLSYNRKKDTFTVKKTYFYRFGMTSTKLADRLQLKVPGGVEVVDRGDMFRAWPKSSYFWVEFTANEAACREWVEDWLSDNPEVSASELLEEAKNQDVIRY